MTTEYVSDRRAEMVKEILNILSLTDDTLLADPDAFWQQVALAFNREPGMSALETARTVLEGLGEWDDDYLMEDRSGLSDEAYNELLSFLNGLTDFGTLPLNLSERQLDLVPEEEDVIDDATSWASAQYGVGDFLRPDADTLLNWIYAADLVVNPAWQRNFVWPLKKQRSFIESVLMGLPIPSLLLFENPDTNKKYVIDGRQRLETLATFCADPQQRAALGFLKRRFKSFPQSQSLWRPGEPLHEAAGKYFDRLPDSFKRKIKGTPLTVFTFRGLTSRQLYQIFQRYNTGAEKLRAAEIRNAVYQDRNLHKMLWRMAGESPERLPYADDQERDVADTLHNIMRNKVARYGTYDFLGRVLAFTYVDNGKTVAVATNDFLDQYEGSDLGSIRQRFFAAFEAVLRWYQYPLTTPSYSGSFHGFLGTIQLATADAALGLIERQEVTEDEIVNLIRSEWNSFADRTLEMKQNSSNFWSQQKQWLRQLASAGN